MASWESLQKSLPGYAGPCCSPGSWAGIVELSILGYGYWWICLPGGMSCCCVVGYWCAGQAHTVTNCGSYSFFSGCYKWLCANLCKSCFQWRRRHKILKGRMTDFICCRSTLPLCSMMMCTHAIMAGSGAAGSTGVLGECKGTENKGVQLSPLSMNKRNVIVLLCP